MFSERSHVIVINEALRRLAAGRPRDEINYIDGIDLNADAPVIDPRVLREIPLAISNAMNTLNLNASQNLNGDQVLGPSLEFPVSQDFLFQRSPSLLRLILLFF